MYRQFLFAVLLAGLLSGPAFAQDFVVDNAVKSDRNAVRNLQSRLNDLGFNAGGVDGAFGRRTQSALEAFAERFPSSVETGLTPDMADRVAAVHHGRFGNPYESDLILPKAWPHGTLAIKTDVREANPDCGFCNVTSLIQQVGDLDGDEQDEIVLSDHASDGNFDVINRPTRLTIVSPSSTDYPRLFPGIAPDDLPSRVHERESVIADFNGDGLGDLFVSAHGFDRPPFPGEQNVLLLSSPDGHRDVSASHLPQLDDMSHGVTEGDIDADGDIDLLIITNEGRQDIIPYLLINDGEGRFERTDISTVIDPALVDFRRSGRRHRAEYSTARLIDLNDDQFVDLLLLARGEEPQRATRYRGTRQSLLIYNDGSGRFPNEKIVELPTDRWGYATFTNDADAADLDGDGKLDLVLTQSTRKPRFGDWYGQYVQVLMNEDGSFIDRTAERMWPQGYPDMDRLSFADNTRLGDFDQDGDVDLVTQNLSPTWHDDVDDGAIMIGQNNGDGVFEPVDPRWLKRGGYTNRNLVLGRFGLDGALGFASYGLNGQYDTPPDRTFGVKLDVYTLSGL